jgi:hypothetical protein
MYRPSGTRILNYGNPVNWDSPLTRGLVSWWLPLPQNSGGLRLMDLCNRFHGTRTASPTWRGGIGPGSYGALNFLTASSQFVNCGASAAMQLTTSPLTLIVRFRPSGDYTTTQTLFACSTNTSGIQWGLEFGRTDNKFTFLNNSGAVHLTSTASVSTDVDTHVVLVRGGSAGAWTFAFYINGQTDATGSTAGNPDATSGTTAIGCYYNSGGAFAPATAVIAEAMLFNRNLTQSEAKLWFDSSRQGHPLTLNYINPLSVFASAGGGGATAFPWHYYQQMMAG